MNEKLVVVSGGSRGIGKAIVQYFLAKGFSVATCGRSQESLSELEKECKIQYPKAKLIGSSVDLSSTEATKKWGEDLLSLHLPIEILVNNVGIFYPGEICTEEEGRLESLLQLNLISVYHLTRKLVPWMVLKKRGHIFNVCSIASQVAYPNGGSYSISKFALYGFGKVLREELKNKGIRVTNLLPGATLTDSWTGINLPEERFIKTDDIAKLIGSIYELSEYSVVEDVIIRPQLGDI